MCIEKALSIPWPCLQRFAVMRMRVAEIPNAGREPDDFLTADRTSVSVQRCPLVHLKVDARFHRFTKMCADRAEHVDAEADRPEHDTCYSHIWLTMVVLAPSYS